MKRNNYPSKKSNAGRPTDYLPSHADRAFKICLLLNATNDQLALCFGVSVSSIEKWQREHPEFKSAIKRGKTEADSDVALSMYEQACGYYRETTESRVAKDGKLSTVTYMKWYPPVPVMGIYWTKNRQKETWRDVHRQEHTGAGGGPIKVHDEIDLTGLNTEELEFVQRIGLKAKGKNGSGRNRINFPSN